MGLIVVEAVLDVFSNLQCYQWVISGGLLLDAVGVVMLYFFGLPSRFPSVGDTITDSTDRASDAIRSWFTWMSRTGIFLLVLGFLVQIIGTLMN